MNERRPISKYANKDLLPVADHRRRMLGQATQAPNSNLTLIPWNDIWTSVKLAKLRGHNAMVKAFYDMLFSEALFDDRGAWSSNVKKRN